MWRSYGDIPVAADFRPCPGDNLHADIFFVEMEIVRSDSNHVRDLDDGLCSRGGRGHMLFHGVVINHTHGAQEAIGHVHGDIRCGAGPVLATFDQQGAARIFRIVEKIIVAHPAAGSVTRIKNDKTWGSDSLGKEPAFPVTPGQDKRFSRILHGMNVEQEIRFIDDRVNFAGPVPFDALGIAFQDTHIPDPVEILVDKPREGRVVGPELCVGCNVTETECEGSGTWADIVPEQMVERDCATKDSKVVK